MRFLARLCLLGVRKLKHKYLYTLFAQKKLPVCDRFWRDLRKISPENRFTVGMMSIPPFVVVSPMKMDKMESSILKVSFLTSPFLTSPCHWVMWYGVYVLLITGSAVALQWWGPTCKVNEGKGEFWLPWHQNPWDFSNLNSTSMIKSQRFLGQCKFSFISVQRASPQITVECYGFVTFPGYTVFFLWHAPRSNPWINFHTLWLIRCVFAQRRSFWGLRQYQFI